MHRTPTRRTSHARLSHDGVEALGYDWARVGEDPGQGRFPAKVYLPEDTAGVVRAVQETACLGQRLVVRGAGHSSNDLVFADGGALLSTARMSQVLIVDARALTVKVQAGAMIGAVDEALARYGLGLPVVPDHHDITVGGFASVGGMSPASLHDGMFVDTVVGLEYVSWDGRVMECGPTVRGDEFRQVLAGTGRHGVITTLTCSAVPIDKRTVLRNDRRLHVRYASWVRDCVGLFKEPADVRMARAVWLDVPGGRLGVGQVARYRATEQRRTRLLRRNAAYGALHALGERAGRLPEPVDEVAKYLGTMSLIASPRYAARGDVERFTDAIIDHTVGDPTRMLVVLAPVDRCAEVMHELRRRCLDLREREGCFTFLSIQAKGVRSAYLAGDDHDQRYAEVMAVLGFDRRRMHPDVLEELATWVDDLCIERGCLRYMHTKTSSDARRRALVDPNARYRPPMSASSDGAPAARAIPC
jgi:FAD/FMN-containing dehydrogenase